MTDLAQVAMTILMILKNPMSTSGNTTHAHDTNYGWQFDVRMFSGPHAYDGEGVAYVRPRSARFKPEMVATFAD